MSCYFPNYIFEVLVSCQFGNIRGPRRAPARAIRKSSLFSRRQPRTFLDFRFKHQPEMPFSSHPHFPPSIAHFYFPPFCSDRIESEEISMHLFWTSFSLSQQVLKLVSYIESIYRHIVKGYFSAVFWSRLFGKRRKRNVVVEFWTEASGNLLNTQDLSSFIDNCVHVPVPMVSQLGITCIDPYVWGVNKV